mmetsp:Transcript_6722/g.8629  ORF Transcript_6722/g.8629 Transcript_6722/m.8629 type:complete len:240 (-) Transcript_6722:248-967(-)
MVVHNLTNTPNRNMDNMSNNSSSLKTNKQSQTQPNLSHSTQPRRVSLPSRDGVSFSSFATVHYLLKVPTASLLTDEERHALWYSEKELNASKNAAKTVSRCLRKKVLKDANKKQHLPIRDEDMECVRGLELRSSSERQKRKNIAIYTILECQRRLQARAFSDQAFPTAVVDPILHLAIVSRKATQWSSQVAIADAREDYATLYSTQYSHKHDLNYPSCPISTKRRRIQQSRNEMLAIRY